MEQSNVKESNVHWHACQRAPTFQRLCRLGLPYVPSPKAGDVIRLGATKERLRYKYTEQE